MKFLDEMDNKMYCDCISTQQTLSEEFIEYNMDKVNWLQISESQCISESFIEKHIDRMNWSYISAYQTLSESFIEKHIDNVNWFFLFKNKKINMSYEFIVKHIYRFNLYEVFCNSIVFNNVIKAYPEKYNMDKILYQFNTN